ncbi:MAG: SRPBCC domain-containing protein [Solirubrobacterales bacterium]|nr:SRPBCC domain-containing protein [Solirubrobacterales bacterium]
MVKQWEVRWEGVLPAAPQAVWDAITRHADGYLWRIEYEPWVGGAERGLTAGGGTVTAWDPPRRFATRSRPEAERDGLNELDYVLEPLGGGATYLRYVHRAEVPAGDFDRQLAACRAHTAFYQHSLGQYACFFAGREAAYVSVEAPEAATFAALRRALGLPGDVVAGDPVRLTPAGLEPIEGVVDYATGPFLGVRTADALYRVYGRDTWGWPAGIAHHLFAADADQAAAQRDWEAWAAGVFESERVA